MSSRYSSCFALISPNNRCRSTCEKPMIAFSGVRSSCDMLARNSLLCSTRDLELAALLRKLCQRLLQLLRAFLDLLLQALNRCLQARRHPVQLVCQATQLVATAELDPLVVGARPDAGCCRPHLLDQGGRDGGRATRSVRSRRRGTPRAGAPSARSFRGPARTPRSRAARRTPSSRPARRSPRCSAPFRPRKLRPTVDPVFDEASALVTCGKARERCVKAALFGCAIGTPLVSTA